MLKQMRSYFHVDVDEYVAKKTIEAPCLESLLHIKVCQLEFFYFKGKLKSTN